MNEKEIKDMVKQKYNTIALENKENESCCCKSKKVYTIMSDNYKGLSGYNDKADIGLGCGLPTQFAKIRKGDTVIDLGSGAGNDCFVARAETGEEGKVIGIDFSPAMVEKAKLNAKTLNFKNIEFFLGDIENTPLEDNIADVVISNCVLNLVPNKSAIFSEIKRVLKPGGHFSISDIVLTGVLPQKLKQPAEMYAGCVASAIQKENYLKFIYDAGFKNITIQKEKPIIIPDDILKQYLNNTEITDYKSNPTVIYSITVYAEKP